MRNVSKPTRKERRPSREPLDAQLSVRTSIRVSGFIDHIAAKDIRSRSQVAEILLREALTARGFDLESVPTTDPANLAESH